MSQVDGELRSSSIQRVPRSMQVMMNSASRRAER
jgi:hypothetical protein